MAAIRGCLVASKLLNNSLKSCVMYRGKLRPGLKYFLSTSMEIYLSVNVLNRETLCRLVSHANALALIYFHSWNFLHVSASRANHAPPSSDERVDMLKEIMKRKKEAGPEKKYHRNTFLEWYGNCMSLCCDYFFLTFSFNFFTGITLQNCMHSLRELVNILKAIPSNKPSRRGICLGFCLLLIPITATIITDFFSF